MQLAHLVAQAHIQRLALIGLAKNVGKTTTTNHLIETLLTERLYQREELGLTSLGLDGEAVDALTGLPKPRYIPEPGLFVATAETFLTQAEYEGALFQRCRRLPGRTAVGDILLARVIRSGQVIIAGPTLLDHLRSTLNLFNGYGVRLGIVDGAINRLSTASPRITDGCIICTGTSVAASVEQVAYHTADVITKLSVPTTVWWKLYRDQCVRLSASSMQGTEAIIQTYDGPLELEATTEWMTKLSACAHYVYLFRGALTEDFAVMLFRQRRKHTTAYSAELVVEDATKIFCRPLLLQHLATEGLQIRVAAPIHILAITINPSSSTYSCASQRLLDTLQKALPEHHPPLLDICLEKKT